MAKAFEILGLSGNLNPQDTKEAYRAQKTVYFEQGEAQIWSSGDITLHLKRLSVTQALRIRGLLNDDQP